MSSRPLPQDERVLDLLARQATEGLDAREAEELEQALSRLDADAVDTQGLALAAAAVEVSAIEDAGEREALPDSLAAVIVDEGRRMVAEDSTRTTPGHAGLSAGDTTVAPARDHGGWRLFRSATLGWLTAAAAILVAATAIFFTLRQGGEPDPVAARERLLQTAEDAVVAQWSKTTPDFAKVTGNIVWSDRRQQGYMQLTGMPVNDPRQQQYQLWIVDPQRDEQPVDGGVFNISEDGTVTLPIHAKLPVYEPQLFAITVEQPGGVVVSENELEVIAPVSG